MIFHVSGSLHLQLWPKIEQVVRDNILVRKQKWHEEQMIKIKENVVDELRGGSID